MWCGWFNALIASLFLIAGVSCAARPVRVGLAFDSDWHAGSPALTMPEQIAVRAAALESLRQAFHGFDVNVSETREAGHLVIVDQGYVPGLRSRGQPAPVGETFALSVVSRVHVDEMFHTLIAVAGCTRIDSGCAKTRPELIVALGRGIGATAAHELGHQVGFRFATDAACDTCYDGGASNTREHFFGTLHWSDAALAIMRRVLPSGTRDR